MLKAGLPTNLALGDLFGEGTPEQELVNDMIVVLRRYAKLMQSKTVKRGIAEAKSRGRAIGGQRPDRLPASVISTIMQWRKEGCTQREITTMLNERGIPTTRGGTWHLRSVQLILARIEADTYRLKLGESRDDVQSSGRGVSHPSSQVQTYHPR